MVGECFEGTSPDTSPQFRKYSPRWMKAEDPIFGVLESDQNSMGLLPSTTRFFFTYLCLLNTIL